MKEKVLAQGSKFFSDEEVVKIIDEYENGDSAVVIAKRYKVSNTPIYNLIHKHSMVRDMSLSHRKYPINENFLDEINSEEKAYFLGLFYADGSNNEKKGCAYIGLAELDKQILLKLTNIIQPTKPLYLVKYSDLKHQDQFRINIDNKSYSQRLKELGCPANKTHKIVFPSWLNEDLYPHFIRGYFDGDGHIGIYNKKAHWSIIGTEDFCKSIVEVLKGIDINIKKLGIRYPEKNNNIRSIEICGNRQIQKLMDWIYKDASLYMDRKFNKYQELLNLNRIVDEKLSRNRR